MATVRHQLTVSRVVLVAPGVVNIEMTGLQLDGWPGSGGRFFIWRFLAPGMWWHPHPFSLSAEPVHSGRDGQGTLRITVRNLGRGSAQLARLKPGTKVAVEGPYGLVQHGGPEPGQGGDDRRRHRHHPAAGPAGNARRSTRATQRSCSAATASRSST